MFNFPLTIYANVNFIFNLFFFFCGSGERIWPQTWAAEHMKIGTLNKTIRPSVNDARKIIEKAFIIIIIIKKQVFSSNKENIFRILFIPSDGLCGPC